MQFGSSQKWSPEGALEYGKFYPGTVSLEAGEFEEMASVFSSAWERVGSRSGCWGASEGISFVMVRGIFGKWMPGHFKAPLARFRERDLDAWIAKGKPAGGIGENSRALAEEVRSRAAFGKGSFVFLAHSKGGLEVLRCLQANPDIRALTRGVILVQSPRGPSAVLESVLLGQHRDTHDSKTEALKENGLAWLIRATGSTPGCVDLTGGPIREQIRAIDAQAWDFPVLSVATWSIEPCAWLDSYHKRLGQIRPGHAHDGQFYMEDQVWPRARRLLLGRVDHAQPVVGGLGFDHGRFWEALAWLFLRYA